MKKRISIYIEEGIWDLAKVEARRISVEVNLDISASEVVEDSIKEFCGVKDVPPVKKDKFKTVVSEIVEAVESFEKTYDRTEAQIIAEGQAKLDAARKGRGSVKAEKIAKVKSAGYFNPQPKSSAKGKK